MSKRSLYNGRSFLAKMTTRAFSNVPYSVTNDLKEHIHNFCKNLSTLTAMPQWGLESFLKEVF